MSQLVSLQALKLILVLALVTGASAYCNGDFAYHQVTDYSSCQERCQFLLDDGQIPNTTIFRFNQCLYDRSAGRTVCRFNIASASWRDETSGGANGGPVWSSKCTCGVEDDPEEVIYCWEVGTAGWVFMAIILIPLSVCAFVGIAIVAGDGCFSGVLDWDGDASEVAGFIVAAAVVLTIGLTAGLSSHGLQNGGPGAGDFNDKPDDSLSTSAVQFIVLGAASVVLFITQYVARNVRGQGSDNESLPMLVEIITFFSMLDLITDVTYLVTENWANSVLEILASLFVAAPFVAIGGYFMFKTYRHPDGYFLLRIIGFEALGLIVIATFAGVAVNVFDAILTPSLQELDRQLKRLRKWGKKKSKESLVFLIATFLGFCVLGIGVVITVVGCILAYLLYAIMTFVILTTMPLIYAFMVVVRSFAVFPGAWAAFEHVFDDEIQMPWGEYEMPDETREALFHQNGGSQGDNTADIYYMLSTTLLYEFIFETLPQIIIQAINNNLQDSWSGFAYASIGVSAFVACDALYRQFCMVILFGVKFGSPDVFKPKDLSPAEEEAEEMARAARALAKKQERAVALAARKQERAAAKVANGIAAAEAKAAKDAKEAEKKADKAAKEHEAKDLAKDAYQRQATLKAQKQAATAELYVGARVTVEGCACPGTLRFFGNHAVYGSPRCGVELDLPLGKNSGTVQGTAYFSCKDKHGILIMPERVTVQAAIRQLPELEHFGFDVEEDTYGALQEVRECGYPRGKCLYPPIPGNQYCKIHACVGSAACTNFKSSKEQNCGCTAATPDEDEDAIYGPMIGFG